MNEMDASFHIRFGILCLLLLESLLSNQSWAFTVKYCPDGMVDRYMARQVARGFTQTYEVGYQEKFSNYSSQSIRVLFSLAVNQQWAMFELDMKNAFLYGDLHEQVCIKQHPGYIAHRRIWYTNSRRGIQSQAKPASLVREIQLCYQYSFIKFFQFCDSRHLR